MMDEITSQWFAEFQTASAMWVREMLEKKPDLVNVRVQVKGKKRTFERGPLFQASRELADLEKVKALVEAGASLENGPLGTHWPSPHYEVNAYFIEQGVDIDQPSYLGFHAMGVTGLDSFFLMMENGMKPNYAWPYNGETLLHVTAREDRDDHLAKAYTLIKAGANVNAVALSGFDDEPIMANEHFVKHGHETPLHFAAREDSPQMARLLLTYGANPSLRTVSRLSEPQTYAPWPEEIDTWHQRNIQRMVFEAYPGETPKEMATRLGNTEVARIIQDYE